MNNEFDIDVDDVIEEHELAMESINADSIKYDAVCRMATEVKSTGLIDKCTMETIDELYPNAVDPEYPINSYTTQPTSQNVDVGMEGLLLALFGIIITLVGGLILFVNIAWASVLLKKDVDNKIKKFFNRTKKYQSKDDEVIDKFNRAVDASDKYSDKPSNVDRVIEFYAFGGPAVRLFLGWDHLLKVHIESVEDDIKTLSSAIDDYGKADIDSTEVISICNAIVGSSPSSEAKTIESIIDASLNAVGNYSKSELMDEISSSNNFVRWFTNQYSYNRLLSTSDEVITPSGSSATYEAAESLKKTQKDLTKLNSKLKSDARKKSSDIEDEDLSEMHLIVKRAIMTIRRDSTLVGRFMKQYSYLQGFYSIIYKSVVDATKHM